MHVGDNRDVNSVKAIFHYPVVRQRTYLRVLEFEKVCFRFDSECHQGSNESVNSDEHLKERPKSDRSDSRKSIDTDFFSLMILTMANSGLAKGIKFTREAVNYLVWVPQCIEMLTKISFLFLVSPARKIAFQNLQQRHYKTFLYES